MPPRRACLSLLALALAAAAAWPRPPLPPPKGHDLRGPAIPKGLVLTIKTTATMKDGELSLDPGTGKMSFKVSFTGSSEKVAELLAVTARQPTHVRTKVVNDLQKAEYAGQGAPPTVATPSPLIDQVVESKLVEKKWQHVLANEKSTDEIKSALGKFGPWSPEDGLFPPRKVRVGDSWDVDTKDLVTFAGGGAKVKGFTGKGKGKLRAIERYRGEPCAVVEYTLTTKGTQHDGPMALTVASTIKLTVYRSLRLGITLRSVAEADIKASGDQFKVSMTGVQKTETVTTVKE